MQVFRIFYLKTGQKVTLLNQLIPRNILYTYDFWLHYVLHSSLFHLRRFSIKDALKRDDLSVWLRLMCAMDGGEKRPIDVDLCFDFLGKSFPSR